MIPLVKVRRLPLIWPVLILTMLWIAARQDSSALSPDALTDIPSLIYHLDPSDFDSEEAFQSYIQDLAEQFPADINRVSGDLLLLIPDIPPEAVDAILSHRNNNTIATLEDLLELPELDSMVLEKIRPWLTVDNRPSGGQKPERYFQVEQMFRYQQTLPVAEGYRGKEDEPPHYAGPPGKIYQRQSVTGEKISFNMTQIKLPGEPMVRPLGFDFTSAHLQVKEIGPFENIVIGDYALRFGQGLALWSTPSFGKGGATHNAAYRRTMGISPYRSSGQIRFFRGIATASRLPVASWRSLPEGAVTVSLFYSNRPRSAVEMEGDTIRPPSSSAYHRTETERSRRHNTQETVIGGNMELENRIGVIGLTHYRYRLDRPVLPYSQSHPYKGQEHQVTAGNLTLKLRDYTLYGELGLRTSASRIHHQNRNDQHAWSAGVTGTIAGLFDWTLSLRNFKPGYWSEFGNSFAEGTGYPTNQKGWYFGYRIRPGPSLVVNGYIDRFIFPNPRPSDSLPSDGWESALYLRYRPLNDLTLQASLRYKKRTGERNAKDHYSRLIRVTETTHRSSGRVRMVWQVFNPFQWRVEMHHTVSGSDKNGNSHGLALGNTARWQIREALQMDISRTVFDTQDFTSRIYIYEYGLTRTMTSRMAYGKGLISAFTIRVQPYHWLLAELQYSTTRYVDRPAIGTSRDRTLSPLRSYVGLQLRFQY